MKLTAVLAVLLSAGLQAQTTLPPSQQRKSAIVGAMVCWPDDATTKGECVIAQFDPSIELDRSFNPPMLKSVITSNSPTYVPGPTGGLVIDNLSNPKQIDIATETVPRKAQSETIAGLWTFVQGIKLSPVTLPVCDSITEQPALVGAGVQYLSKGRLLQDAVDGVLKYCDGTAWQPILPHTHWQFRTSTAILTASQSTFNIVDPTIVPDSLQVFRNGLLMTLGPDYTRGGLGAAAPVVFTAAQAPQAGDTVTLKYMW